MLINNWLGFPDKLNKQIELQDFAEGPPRWATELVAFVPVYTFDLPQIAALDPLRASPERRHKPTILVDPHHPELAVI